MSQRTDESTQTFQQSEQTGVHRPVPTEETMVGGPGTGTQEAVPPEDHHDQQQESLPYGEGLQRDRFGGVNWGAGFLGWLVAASMSGLIFGLLGAALVAAGPRIGIEPAQLTVSGQSVGIAAAAVLVGVLIVGYYTGGYVAGRMCRFDGGKQGAGVWVSGVLATVVVVSLGLLVGSEFDILATVNLSPLPVPDSAFGIGGAITAAAAVVGTLVAAMAGGSVGCLYHRKVDALGYR